MTSFTIETARPSHNLTIDRASMIMDAVYDSLPEDATQAQIDGAVVQIITGELRSPKRLKTVRADLIRLWPLIAPLANSYPEGFDAILLEYAELSTVLT